MPFTEIIKNIIVPMLIFAFTGALFGLLIALFSQLFAVKVDERIESVAAMLPGYNCGACGSPGCAAFAARIVAGEDPKLCKPGRQDMRDAIAAYLAEAAKSEENPV